MSAVRRSFSAPPGSAGASRAAGPDVGLRRPEETVREESSPPLGAGFGALGWAPPLRGPRRSRRLRAQRPMAAAALRRPAEVSARPGPSPPRPPDPAAWARGDGHVPGPGVQVREALVGDTRRDGGGRGHGLRGRRVRTWRARGRAVQGRPRPASREAPGTECEVERSGPNRPRLGQAFKRFPKAAERSRLEAG